MAQHLERIAAFRAEEAGFAAKNHLISFAIIALVFAIVAILAIAGFTDRGQTRHGSVSLNGFDIGFSLIPQDEILSGGPPKDGIPALTNPEMTPAGGAGYLGPSDLVVGVSIENESRAYPLRVLNWHENINDAVGGVPVAVSYCPLCRSALVFDRRIGGSVREFGVSGLLWNSNVLLYDRQAEKGQESLWSQVQMRAVTGPAAGDGLRMKLLPAALTTWEHWTSEHPDTLVVSENTGFSRNYRASPYKTYFLTDRVMFPVSQEKVKPERFRNKEPMVLVQVGDEWKAYAVRDIEEATGAAGWIEDVVGGKALHLTYSKQEKIVTAELVGEETEKPPTAYMFWFALSAMLPHVEVYEPPSTAGTPTTKTIFDAE